MLDTNILLDWLFDRNKKRTSKIKDLLEEAVNVHVPDMVMIELAFALEKIYELPRTVVVDNLKTILSNPAIDCDQALFNPALACYLNHPSLSLLDCCLLEYGKLYNRLPVYTFDKKLINQSEGRAVTP